MFKPKEYDYFGEKALLNSAPRAANVIATTPVTVLYVEKSAFEEVLGPLAQIIELDAGIRSAVSDKVFIFISLP